MTAVLELTKKFEVNGKKYATTTTVVADTAAFERAQNTNCRPDEIRNNII